MKGYWSLRVPGLEGVGSGFGAWSESDRGCIDMGVSENSGYPILESL